MKICSTSEVNSFQIQTIEIVINKLTFDHQMIIWNHNIKIHYTRLNVTDCGNVSLSGVAQDVPINKGFLSTHTFSCITGYEGIPTVAVCQADATWGLKPFCAEDIEVFSHSETWSTNFSGDLYELRFLKTHNLKSAKWLLGTETCNVDWKANNTLSNSRMNHFKCSWVISGEYFYSQLATKTHLHVKFNNTEVTFQTNRSTWKTVIHISDCGNVTLPGVVQDVPVNKGYLSTHTFSCIQPFYLPATAVAVCQSDATWNVTSFCTTVLFCNNTAIPNSDLYQQPTPGTTFYPNSKTLFCNQHYIGTVTAQCSKQGTWNITNSCAAKGFPVGYIVGILLVAEVVVFIVICSICFSYKKILKRKSSRQHDQHKISAESSSSSRDMRIINVPMGAVSDEYTPLIGEPGLRRRKNIPTTNTPTEKDDISTQVQNYVDLLQTKKFDEAKAIKQQLLRSIESQLEITADDLEVEARKLRNNHDYLEAILFFSITADFCVKKTPDFAVAKHVAEYAGEIKETIKLFMENSDSSSESRNREIVRDHVIPLMRDIIQQIRDFQIDEKIRCEKEVWCLHHIERSQDYIGDLTSRETTIKLGLELMESKFGNESSKYSIYGTLLNNLGAVCEETSRIKEAIVYYTKAIEVYKTAEDLTEKQRVAEIERSEENINFCK